MLADLIQTLPPKDPLRGIFGTKQRRNGPEPDRRPFDDVLAASPNRLHVFVPCGASKQDPYRCLDALEFSAFCQLRALQDEVKMPVRFHFRLEDWGDRWLLDASGATVYDYCTNFERLARFMLTDVNIVYESTYIDWPDFRALCMQFREIFAQRLRGKINDDELEVIGWYGGIDAAMVAHYGRCFQRHYPNADPLDKAAEYFAAALARVRLNATGSPKEPFITVSFVQPGPRPTPTTVYYRTLPTHTTHNHIAPWLGAGTLVGKEIVYGTGTGKKELLGEALVQY